MSLMVSADVKQHWTMLRHWLQFVPNNYVNPHPRTWSSTSPASLHLAEWPGSFTCYCGNTGGATDTEMSQHRNVTLEKKILPPLLPGLEPETFRSWVRRSTAELSQLPVMALSDIAGSSMWLQQLRIMFSFVSETLMCGIILCIFKRFDDLFCLSRVFCLFLLQISPRPVANLQ